MAHTGETALNYFQRAFPHVSPFGEAGSYQNPAEWIVDITTKVSAAQSSGHECHQNVNSSALFLQLDLL